MSEANDSAAVSGANDSAAVSGANDSAAVSGDESVEPTVAEEHQTHEAPIQILKGNPTEEEVGVLLAVLAAASGTPAEPREQEENLWGHPVDRLRYSFFSWQKVALQQRTHMRHR